MIIVTIKNNEELPINEPLAFAENSKDAIKATYIEAIEDATKETFKIHAAINNMKMQYLPKR